MKPEKNLMHKKIKNPKPSKKEKKQKKKITLDKSGNEYPYWFNH